MIAITAITSVSRFDNTPVSSLWLHLSVPAWAAFSRKHLHRWGYSADSYIVRMTPELT